MAEVVVKMRKKSRELKSGGWFIYVLFSAIYSLTARCSVTISARPLALGVDAETLFTSPRFEVSGTLFANMTWPRLQICWSWDIQ